MNRLYVLLIGFVLSYATSALGQNVQDNYEVKEIRNVVYKIADGQEIKLNLFLPTKDGVIRTNSPLLVDIVSGGWHSGDPGDGGFWRACRCVERGYAVASVSHRSVSKECVFPSQIEDVKAAVRFLRANAKKYGIDAQRIAATGASSGGHMASMLGLPDKFRQFDVGDNLDQSSQVQVVVDLCCTADMKFYLERSPEQTPEPVYSVLGAEKREPYAEQAASILDKARIYSPITYVDPDFSPTIILQGAQDEAVVPSQSCLFYEELKRAGVRTQLWIDNNVGHTAGIFSAETREKIIFDFIQWD